MMHKKQPSLKLIALLLVIAAGLMLSVRLGLLEKYFPVATPPEPQAESLNDKTPPAAVTISNENVSPLTVELAKAEEELRRAQAEREETSRRIEVLNNTLKQKLEEAQLEN